MVNVSSACKQAIAAGAFQRIALVFSNRIISNEDIDVEGGVDLREVFCGETELTIGLCPASEISFAVFNDDGRFSNFEFGTFDAYIGVLLSYTQNSSAATRHPVITVDREHLTMTASGNGRLENYELCPLGRFIAPRPAVVRKALIDVVAYDQMKLFDEDMPSSTDLAVSYPLTAAGLLAAMCSYVGVQAESYSFLNADATLSSEPKSFEYSTMREVLGWIAQTAGANARFNRMGKLEMAWLNTVTEVFDEHNYVEFEPYRYSVPLVDRLHVRNEDSTADTIVGSGDNTYLIQNNPFLRQEDLTQGFTVLVMPTRRSAFAGENVHFTANVLGATNPTYLWQSSYNQSTWRNLSATTATLAVSATNLNESAYFRVVVTDPATGEQRTSNTVRLVLREPIEEEASET